MTPASADDFVPEPPCLLVRCAVFNSPLDVCAEGQTKNCLDFLLWALGALRAAPLDWVRVCEWCREPQMGSTFCRSAACSRSQTNTQTGSKRNVLPRKELDGGAKLGWFRWPLILQICAIGIISQTGASR